MSLAATAMYDMTSWNCVKLIREDARDCRSNRKKEKCRSEISIGAGDVAAYHHLHRKLLGLLG